MEMSLLIDIGGWNSVLRQLHKQCMQSKPALRSLHCQSCFSQPASAIHSVYSEHTHYHLHSGEASITGTGDTTKIRQLLPSGSSVMSRPMKQGEAEGNTALSDPTTSPPILLVSFLFFLNTKLRHVSNYKLAHYGNETWKPQVSQRVPTSSFWVKIYMDSPLSPHS